MTGWVRCLVAAVWVSGAASAAAQIVDATACDVAGHPAKYDGRTVRIKGLVQVGLDSFQVRGASCNSGLWLSYPAGTKARSGPAAVITLRLASNASSSPAKARTAVVLERNKDFETFDALLSEKPKTPGMCLGCVKNDVQATLIGRVDGTDDPGLKRDAGGKVTGLDGFGNLNEYGARLVLQSVSDVSAKEIDFTQTPKVKDDNAGGNGRDFVAITKKSAAAFARGSDAANQIQRALDALGAPGVDNGVTIEFGATAEVPAGEGIKGAKPSPDGLLLTIRIDTDKLKGDALSRAIAHEGALLDAERGTEQKGLPPRENAAWQTTLLVAIGARQKTLTLPGGVVLWSESWPEPQRTANATAALTQYLTDHEQIAR